MAIAYHKIAIARDIRLSKLYVLQTKHLISKMSQLLIIREHIEITPGVCGGKPRIAGHRIKVQDIAIWHEKLGLSPDEIVSNYPTIDLSDIYAALAYYHDHLEDIRQHIKEDEKYVRDLQVKTPSLIQQKLEGLNG